MAAGYLCTEAAGTTLLRMLSASSILTRPDGPGACNKRVSSSRRLGTILLA